jgi:hypothetical protein
MTPRPAIHYKPASRTAPKGIYTELDKSWHIHFCVNRECRQTYEDYRCEDVSKNERCHDCRGRERPGWETSRDPKPCCYGNTYQVVDKAELIRQRLAGTGPWFKCRTCARSHGWPCHDPNERNA